MKSLKTKLAQLATNQIKRNAAKTAMIALPALAMTGMAHAGAGGTEFQTVYDQLTGWSNGVLGKTIAVSSLLVGIGIGVIKQSVIASVVGISMALVAGFGPGVIDGVVTAGLTITQAI